MKRVELHRRNGALLAALLVASCAQGPTTPTTRTEAAAAVATVDGSAQGSAAGDVKNGPIEIELVRVAQVDGVPAFYAGAGGEYIVAPGREVEIYVQIWRSSPPVTTVPRLDITWGINDKDNIHCGPCRLTKKYDREGKYNVTVSMDDRVGGVTTRSFVLNVTEAEGGGTFTFSNNSMITVNDNVSATPYPSTINASGVTGKIARATVTIAGYSHTFHEDMMILLVGPNGQKVSLMDDVGGGSDANNATVTFEDGAPGFPSALIGPGSFTFSPSLGGTTARAPAPGPPYSGALSVLNGSDANGTWKLFVGDYAGIDIGQIAGGWSLTVTTVASSSVGVVKAGSVGGVSASTSIWPNDHILNYPFQKPDPKE